MKKKGLRGASPALVLMIAFSLILGACGASSNISSDKAATEAPAASADEGYYEGGWGNSTADASSGNFEAPREDSPYRDIESIKNDTLSNANVKLIYTAYMDIQTRSFEDSQEAIRELVDGMGGWFETAQSYYGSYYDQYYGNLRSASYTVRIPAAEYSRFLAAVGEGFHITSIDQSVEDVSLAYSDIETRLATLTTKHERLLELLSKATEMSDIIELENALSSCEYEIDSYTQSKNRYDSLIGYSTVYIEMREVEELDDSVDEDQSFPARLGRALKRGADNFVVALDNFVMWLGYNLIGLIIFAVIVIIAVKLIRAYNDPEKRAARAAERARKRAARGAASDARRGAPSPFRDPERSEPENRPGEEK